MLKLKQFTENVYVFLTVKVKREEELRVAFFSQRNKPQ